MNRYTYIAICERFKIEKRRNAPDTILFQNDDFTAFIKPRFIYVAFSEDMKTEYKAQSKEDLAEYINRMLTTLTFKRK
jgi:hypothetical protein